jgi:hypothetical protein
MTFRTFCLSMSVLLLGASSLDAQRRQNRDGLVAAIGGGVGSAEACRGCLNSTRSTGPTAMARFGWVSDTLITFSLQGIGHFSNVNDGRTDLGFLLFAGQLYPPSPAGLYLEAAVGIGGMQTDGGTGLLQSAGPAYSLGVGYDFRFATNTSLTPYLSFTSQIAAKARLDGVRRSEYVNGNLLQIGVALTRHNIGPSRRRRTWDDPNSRVDARELSAEPGHNPTSSSKN